MKKGLVQIYTGEGKGKTTAALGLALRACGHGFHVFIAQFVKGMEYGELESIRALSSHITLRQYGRRCFIRGKPEKEDFEAARAGWEEVLSTVAGGKFDILILDEIGIALHYALIGVEEVIDLLERKPQDLELVLTGRKIPQELFPLADLVTEMREIKHYYRKGIEARRGIEY